MPALSFRVLAGAGLVLALAAHAAAVAEPGLIGLLEMPLIYELLCDDGEERVTATGWVSAKTPSGVPVAWFWSRGC